MSTTSPDGVPGRSPDEKLEKCLERAKMVSEQLERLSTELLQLQEERATLEKEKVGGPTDEEAHSNSPSRKGSPQLHPLAPSSVDTPPPLSKRPPPHTPSPGRSRPRTRPGTSTPKYSPSTQQRTNSPSSSKSGDTSSTTGGSKIKRVPSKTLIASPHTSPRPTRPRASHDPNPRTRIKEALHAKLRSRSPQEKPLHLKHHYDLRDMGYWKLWCEVTSHHPVDTGIVATTTHNNQNGSPTIKKVPLTPTQQLNTATPAKSPSASKRGSTSSGNFHTLDCFAVEFTDKQSVVCEYRVSGGPVHGFSAYVMVGQCSGWNRLIGVAENALLQGRVSMPECTLSHWNFADTELKIELKAQMKDCTHCVHTIKKSQLSGHALQSCWNSGRIDPPESVADHILSVVDAAGYPKTKALPTALRVGSGGSTYDIWLERHNGKGAPYYVLHSITVELPMTVFKEAAKQASQFPPNLLNGSPRRGGDSARLRKASPERDRLSTSPQKKSTNPDLSVGIGNIPQATDSVIVSGAGSVWREASLPNGMAYYWDIQTREVQWTKPDGIHMSTLQYKHIYGLKHIPTTTKDKQKASEEQATANNSTTTSHNHRHSSPNSASTTNNTNTTASTPHTNELRKNGMSQFPSGSSSSICNLGRVPFRGGVGLGNNLPLGAMPVIHDMAGVVGTPSTSLPSSTLNMVGRERSSTPQATQPHSITPLRHSNSSPFLSSMFTPSPPPSAVNHVSLPFNPMDNTARAPSPGQNNMLGMGQNPFVNSFMNNSGAPPPTFAAMTPFGIW